jgi:hypothetical protein
MRIIRCIWGNRHHEEVKRCTEASIEYGLHPKDQLVYCWDFENLEFIKDLGYNTKYMGENTIGWEGWFVNKLTAFRLSSLTGPFLYLDWDCIQQKPLDGNFWSILEKGESIQMPLYYFPQKAIQKFQTITPFIEEEGLEKTHYFNLMMYQILRYGKWEYNGGLAIPNAGFVYSRDPSFTHDLFRIFKEKTLTTNIEELCALLYFNRYIHSLDEYIDKVEPKVCIGKSDGDMWASQYILNNYINTKANKDIYFIHE